MKKLLLFVFLYSSYSLKADLSPEEKFESIKDFSYHHFKFHHELLSDNLKKYIDFSHPEVKYSEGRMQSFWEIICHIESIEGRNPLGEDVNL